MRYLLTFVEGIAISPCMLPMLPGRGVWSVSDEQLYTLLTQTGENSHIFGLDFPYNNAEHAIRSVARIRNLDIAEETKNKILGINLQEALGV